jgi:hypothetical protein
MTDGSLKTCPNCGNQTEKIISVDTGMRLALSSTGMADKLPDRVCPRCYDTLSGKVSQGVKLRIEQETREKNKMMLWKSRVNLIKQARQLMSAKAYSEAAVAYEKYLRVLEIVYNVKKGELSPDVFSKSKRSKEMTVVTSVYWDLFRIYDTSSRYGDRMQNAGKKLAEFLPFTPIFPDIAKKTEAFLKSSKNPQIVRNFMKQVKIGKGRCFIATAAFESPYALEVMQLRDFRDRYLKTHPPGRAFVRWYYRHSPAFAQKLDSAPRLKPAVRALLRLLCGIIGRVGS